MSDSYRALNSTTNLVKEKEVMSTMKNMHVVETYKPKKLNKNNKLQF